MGGTCVAIVGWLVGMRAQRYHSRSCWFGWVGVGGAKLREWGCLGLVAGRGLLVWSGSRSGLSLLLTLGIYCLVSPDI